MKNLSLETFNFDLPQELIAQQPLANRLDAKLLHVENSNFNHCKVADIPSFFNSGDVIVFNNTKVIKARLLGKKGLASINITLHYMLNDNIWLAFAKNSKRLSIGDDVYFADDFFCTVLEKLDTGEVKLKFHDDNLFEKLEKYGFLPLPPYIKRDSINDSTDSTNYQSIFAQKEGAVASPTASLHFTDDIIQQLKSKGVQIVFITLHVGAGTFLPVKVDNIYDHKMHKEYGEISNETADILLKAQQNGKNIVAIGTTTLRTLEFVATTFGSLQAFAGEIDIFITPSYKFKVVNRLLTNFHLPKSTLFMLVCAFCGIDTMKKAYKTAIENNYRFFSYGDCCLLEKNISS